MIVELSDKLEHTFKDKEDVVCGTIRIGASEAVGCRALALYMKEFREKYRMSSLISIMGWRTTSKRCWNEGCF